MTTDEPQDVPRRRREATLERLLDAALEVFAEQGYQGASIHDVCARAGYTRGAFYSSFSSKDELFLALHGRECERMVDVIEQTVTGFEDADDPLAEAVNRYLAIEEDHRAWHVVAAEFSLHALRHPEAAAALRARERQLLERIADFITRALATVGRELVADPVDVARVVEAVKVHTYQQALLDGDLADHERLERWFLPTWLGVVTREAPADALADANGSRDDFRPTTDQE